MTDFSGSCRLLKKLGFPIVKNVIRTLIIWELRIFLFVEEKFIYASLLPYGNLSVEEMKAENYSN